MIRAIRPSAMAQDDAGLVSGWNVSPNVGYTVVLTPGATACGVLLFDAEMTVLVASGAGLVGTEQPAVLVPQTGQTIGMVDSDLGWHLLLTTTGTESQQTIRIGPAVDLPDEIHPVYSDDSLALARATAAINAGASYVDDVTVTCPLGLGAGIGDVVSVPVGGADVVGQVESVTWTATPDGVIEQAVIRRHTAIAPEASIAPPAPPAVADDATITDAATITSGNVLDNDNAGLTVSAVNGLAANVGQIVAGSNGGDFVINADGAWTFDPSGDFGVLVYPDTADTSVTYHASNGVAEASATLTVTVSSADAQLWDPSMIATALWLDAADAESVLLLDGLVSQWSDKSGNGRHATQAAASLRPAYSGHGVIFTADKLSIPVSAYPNSGVGYMLIALVQSSTTGSTYTGIININSTPSDDPECRIGIGDLVYDYFNYGYALNALDASCNTLGILSHIRATGDTSTLYRNGIHLASATRSGTLSAISEFTLGYYTRIGGYRNGTIREIVVCQNDTDTRQRTEGYIAHKWDALLGVTTLVDALPSDHPNKSAAPTL